MKNLLLAVAWLGAGLLPLPVSAPLARPAGKGGKHQSVPEYRVKLGNSPEHQVQMLLDRSEVNVEAHQGEEVIVQATERFAVPERARGLKPAYYPATDNTGLGLSVVKEGNVLKIRKTSRQQGRYTVRIPRKVSFAYEQLNWLEGTLQVQGMSGPLEIKSNNVRVDLRNVTGPVKASSTSGSVHVLYATPAPGGTHSIASISGEVDVTLPADAKAQLRLESISGEVYSNFELAGPGAKGLKRISAGSVVEGNINGGGVEISLTSTSSNIYLRKQSH